MGTSEQLPERRWFAAYSFELALAIAAYAIILVVSLRQLDDLAGATRAVVALAPMVPFAGVGFVFVRHLLRVDERERLLMYRAVSFAFFATALITFGYGFLENAGAPRLSMFAVWPTMAAMWLLGRFVAPRMP
jgi:hypothetical protein